MNLIVAQQKLVDLQTIAPALVLDLKYATNDNFIKKRVYPIAKCYLIKDAAQALKKASDTFNRLGYTLKIWDGYRPLSIQYLFWQLVPDERYVANPKKGSRHNRGCAIDLTLLDCTGKELAMGTGFDDFTYKAHRDCYEFPLTVLRNREILQTIMEENGFIPWKTEWWHFDFEGWENYPILDVPLDAL